MTPQDPLRDSRQVIVVTSPSWDSIDGEMRRFERDSTTVSWRAVSEPVPVVLGRTGLAWGTGAMALPTTPPQKHEGDGKSPAGVFTLGYAFGFDDSADTKMPYKKLRDTTECVDDVNSPYYNEVVDRDPAGPATWTSSEKMRTIDVYQRGALVNHNIPPKAGGGSCIFLHVWSGASKPTAGCTAMRREDLDALLRWVDPAAKPLIVQLPAGEYSRYINNWRLPDISLTHH
jgi:D-alanyl-D-alanine dipeptidase